ncbi:MAG: LAGLIDADG family homing endonuclease [Candidatus Omnitrophota bacterium]
MPQKRKDLKIAGSNLWYLVGLITSDGCLSSDGRHIDITSSDYKFMQEIRNLIGMGNKIGIKYGVKRQKAFRIQIANKNFYDFLLSIGLMPKKSLVLGRIKVPGDYFLDFLRGLIDGDGGIQRWIHRTNKREQWNLRITSGSRKFLMWLKNKIEKIIGTKGKLYCQAKNQFRVKYGKMAARIIVQRCYYKNSFALLRKKDLAKACIESRVGWSKSKTVIEKGQVVEWNTR